MAKQYGSNSPYPGDKINGKLEQGEYVMNRNVLAIPGMKEYLDELNYEVAPRYAQGGEVNGYAEGGLASWSKSLFDKFKKPAASNESDMPSLGSEEADFFADKYGSAPTPSEELEADSGTYDPHGIFKASEDYNPLAPEAPQKTGLKESLSGFGEKAGHFLEQNVQVPAIQAGIDAKQGLGNIHKYLGAGKADDYQDVLTGKEKGSLYQRAGKGLGMLSSLASEFAAPGQGRGNLKGYGRYKGGETPALKDVAPSEEVDKVAEPIEPPVAEPKIFEEKSGDNVFRTDSGHKFSEEGDLSGLGLSDEEIMEGVDAGLEGIEDYTSEKGPAGEVVQTNSDGQKYYIGPDGNAVIYKKQEGGLIGRAYQNGDYAHSNIDYMVSLENRFQDGGMVSGNNSRRMFDFMKKRRY